MTTPVDIARAAALAGARVLRERAGSLGRVRTKSSPGDLVTEVDIASGVEVVRAIAAEWPSPAIIVEEPEVHGLTGTEPASLRDPEVWVIDPLDGTTSYVHGYPCYSVSVALLRDGVPVAGAVANAANGEVYTASAGGGAALDGRAIRVTDADAIATSLLITGFPYDRTVTLDRQLRILERVLRSVHGVRRDGSAALDCCQVAAGRADGFWELALQPWDVAAGVLIASEAGAVVTDLHGAPWTPETRDHVVAGPRLHGPLLELIRAVEAGGAD